MHGIILTKPTSRSLFMQNRAG